MKKILIYFILICLLIIPAGCVNNDGGHTMEQPSQSTASQQTGTQPESPITEEEANTLKIVIKIGNTSFSATLYDNESAIALTELFPITLNMSELNGNEKYYYLDGSLPTDSVIPSGINAGDLMLYGNNCLVLFYESFSTSYSYTPLGYIDDTQGLAAALGNGSVQVTFQNTSIIKEEY